MNLLIELGCEELPAKGLSELAQALANGVADGLRKRGLAFAQHQALWTPRRLAVLVSDVAAQTEAQASERRGPALAAAFDAAGNPSKALAGFAASCGVEVSQLERLETDKGSWLVHRAMVPGRAVQALIPEVFSDALQTLPVGKPMRWGANEFAFLRPVLWITALLDAEVIALSAYGKTSDRLSYGHRFHAPEAIVLSHALEYVPALQKAYVWADAAMRRQQIRSQSQALAAEMGGIAQISESLLDEVANLTEWPVPLACTIPAEFMRLPPETIITTIETHQKYFPITNATGALLPAFIGVANLQSLDPAEIRKGYERVVRPRLADAAFFFDLDLKTPLASHQVALKSVTFQQKLGSVWDKSVRVAALAKNLSGALGVDAELAMRAALLAKCDLMSRMVGEFPELQGLMGKTYALAQGESAELALALDEVYSPRFAGAPIATSPLGKLLAVSERLDSLAGIFAVGQKPSGNKDAFGLRRAALGLARNVIEGQIKLDLPKALRFACGQIPGAGAELPNELYSFIVERLRAYYSEQGVAGELLDAVAERKPTDLLDFDHRLRAVSAFRALPEASALAAANKRIRNILRKLDGPVPTAIDPSQFELAAERTLHAQVDQAIADTNPLLEAQRYGDVLSRLAILREPVDQYFVDVMVMADQPSVRNNRLASLKRLGDLFLNVADVSVL